MPDERRTLMDIWSGGQYKTSKDLPEIREQAIPILELLTGIEHVPEGKKANALNIRLVEKDNQRDWLQLLKCMTRLAVKLYSHSINLQVQVVLKGI